MQLQAGPSEPVPNIASRDLKTLQCGSEVKYVCMYNYIYIHTCTGIYINIQKNHIHTYTKIHTYIHTDGQTDDRRTDTHTIVCIYVCMYACMCMYMYM